jgi:hypothetical protein
MGNLHWNEFAGLTAMDRAILASRSRPERNIHGDLGPRCPVCSGLGAFLTVGGAATGVTRATSQCRCEGSGLDLVAIERADREILWQQIHALEARFGLPPTSRVIAPPTIKASRQYWMECIAWSTASGTAVASSTTETILFPNVTIPANYMADGRRLRVRLQGKYSTLGSGTVTHVYTVRWGGVAGTILTKTGTVTLLISMTNALFDLDFTIQTQLNGATGQLLADGLARVFGGTAPTIGSATGAPAIAPLTNGGQTVPAAATVDLTADTALSVTITHGANSASNTATGIDYALESMN